jgi:hypothetical protein
MLDVIEQYVATIEFAVAILEDQESAQVCQGRIIE